MENFIFVLCDTTPYSNDNNVVTVLKDVKTKERQFLTGLQ